MSKSKFEYFTRTAKGTESILPPQKRQLFRSLSEGREPNILKKKKLIPLKRELWTSGQLTHFFQDQNPPIHARHTTWTIFFEKPNRKMTPEDQLDLMLQPTFTSHYLKISLDRQHLIIDTLEGDEE